MTGSTSKRSSSTKSSKKKTSSTKDKKVNSRGEKTSTPKVEKKSRGSLKAKGKLPLSEMDIPSKEELESKTYSELTKLVSNYHIPSEPGKVGRKSKDDIMNALNNERKSRSKGKTKTKKASSSTSKSKSEKSKKEPAKSRKSLPSRKKPLDFIQDSVTGFFVILDTDYIIDPSTEEVIAKKNGPSVSRLEKSDISELKRKKIAYDSRGFDSLPKSKVTFNKKTGQHLYDGKYVLNEDGEVTGVLQKGRIQKLSNKDMKYVKSKGLNVHDSSDPDSESDSSDSSDSDPDSDSTGSDSEPDTVIEGPRKTGLRYISSSDSDSDSELSSHSDRYKNVTRESVISDLSSSDDDIAESYQKDINRSKAKITVSSSSSEDDNTFGDLTKSDGSYIELPLSTSDISDIDFDSDSD